MYFTKQKFSFSKSRLTLGNLERCKSSAEYIQVLVICRPFLGVLN